MFDLRQNVDLNALDLRELTEVELNILVEYLFFERRWHHEKNCWYVQDKCGKTLPDPVISICGRGIVFTTPPPWSQDMNLTTKLLNEVIINYDLEIVLSFIGYDDYQIAVYSERQLMEVVCCENDYFPYNIALLCLK